MYLAGPGLSCSMWDLVLWPGIEPGPPALGVWNLRHPGPPGKSLIYYYYYFKWFYFIWPCSAPWGMLVPWPGIKPVSLALRVQNLNHWTARQAPIWIFIGEVCQPLFWTKGYGTNSKCARGYLQKRDIHNSRNPLGEFFDSLNDLVLEVLLPGLRVESLQPLTLTLRVTPGQKVPAPNEHLPPGSWVLGPEFPDHQQGWLCPKPQLLFIVTGLIDHHLFPA